jgi:hypothetical protein
MTRSGSAVRIEAWLLKTLRVSMNITRTPCRGANSQTSFGKENAGREKIRAKGQLLQDEGKKADNAQITHHH